MKRNPFPLIVLFVVLAFLYLPIVMLTTNSFNLSRFGGTWEGFTLNLKLVVNTVSLVPDLVKDPVNVGARLLGSFMGKAGSTGGLADEMQRAPVDSVQVRGTIGSGRVDLQQAVVQSAAFQASAQGVITLAAILTNSPVEIPVSLYLKRSLAAQINLVPANTPTNATYAKLPDFFTVQPRQLRCKHRVNIGIGVTANIAKGSLQRDVFKVI